MPTITTRMNPKDFQASFLSSEKDMETIFKKLFVESKPYSDILKRLLIIDQSDCLDPKQNKYQEIINEYSIHRMKKEGYILVIPRIEQLIHDNFKSHILIEFDDFVRKVEVLNLYNKYSSDEWLYGKWRNFTALRSGQFDWGSVDLSLTVDEQRHLITDVAVATDALDVNLVDTIRKLLVGTWLAVVLQVQFSFHIIGYNWICFPDSIADVGIVIFVTVYVFSNDHTSNILLIIQVTHLR